MRSHDLIRLLDEPGPERWAPLLQISFLDLPRKHELRRAGSRKSRRAAAQSGEILRIRPFWRPGHRIPGDRVTQLGETEVPNAAGQRCEGGLHDQMATPTTGGTATTPGEVDRMRVLTIAITAPQHEQSIGGRSLRGGVKRFGSNFSKRCSKAISACSWRAGSRNCGHGGIPWVVRAGGSARGNRHRRASVFPPCPSWHCDSGSSPGRSRRRGCPVHG